MATAQGFINIARKMGLSGSVSIPKSAKSVLWDTSTEVGTVTKDKEIEEIYRQYADSLPAPKINNNKTVTRPSHPGLENVTPVVGTGDHAEADMKAAQQHSMTKGTGKDSGSTSDSDSKQVDTNDTQPSQEQSGPEIKSTQSGGDTFDSDITAATGGGEANKAQQYQRKRLIREKNSADAQIQEIENNADLSDEEKQKQLNDLYSGFGGAKTRADVNNFILNQAKQGPGFGDYMMGYSVPQTAVGLTIAGGAAAELLSGSGGQKSNAELYSNPF